jgi:hypothetical protein
MTGGRADDLGKRNRMGVAKGKPDTDRNRAVARRMNSDPLGRQA